MGRKISWIFLSGLFLLSLSGISVTSIVLAAQVEKPIVLVANWFGPTEHMRVKNHHVPLCNEIEKRTNGRVKFEHYYSDSLCKITEYPECMRKGMIDVASVSTELVAGKCPLAAAGMPFAGKGDYKNVDKITRSVMDEVDVMYGFKPIAAAFTPYYQLFMRRGKEVKQLNDLKGLNIRGLGGIFGKGLTVVGANNVPVATAEVAVALQRGIVDGVLTYFGTAKTYADLIGSVSKINYASSVGIIAMSAGKWNTLPKDIQNIILTVGREFDGKLIELCETKEVEIEQEFKNAGKKFFELPNDDMTRWKKLVLPLIEKWDEDKGEKGRRIMGTIKKYY